MLKLALREEKKKKKRTGVSAEWLKIYMEGSASNLSQTIHFCIFCPNSIFKIPPSFWLPSSPFPLLPQHADKLFVTAVKDTSATQLWSYCDNAL